MAMFRSFTMLKVKSYSDAEATVIGHESGGGKFEGQMGALVCKSKDGLTFKIGTGFSLLSVHTEN